MKHLLIFILTVICTTTCFSQDGRETHFGIKAGANLSMFSASVNNDISLKPGFNIGVYLRSGKTEKFHLRTELYYSSQGQKNKYVTGSGNTTLGTTTTTINALNIPFLLEAGRKVTFQAGPQFGLLLSGNEKGTINNQKVDEDLKDVMKTLDVSLVVGLGINATDNLNLGVRYNLGISPVFETPQNAPADYPKFSNRVLHFYAGWSF